MSPVDDIVNGLKRSIPNEDSFFAFFARPLRPPRFKILFFLRNDNENLKRKERRESNKDGKGTIG
jgi:hypothetical protein